MRTHSHTAWETRSVRWPTDLDAAVHAFAPNDEVAWLDSGTHAVAGAGHSFIAARPLAVLEQWDRDCARFRQPGRADVTAASAWALWRRRHRQLRVRPTLPWRVGPGWIGYVGFELARQLERLPTSHAADLGLPLLHLGLYDRGIVLDHAGQQAYAVRARDFEHADATPDQDWIERWNAAATTRHTPPPQQVTLTSLTPRRIHEARVRRALDHIAAGDIYQVNLAHRLELTGVTDARSLYAAIRHENPANYAALLQAPGFAVASLSPELMLHVRNRAVLTRPIKGTRPRTGEPGRDDAQRQALMHSAKEAAELAMIVDLHRNDLGRVCEFGSVRVTSARRLEAHPSVYHTVADIVGTLRPECDALDLLAASFPAGSVTGVPKLRAIEIIDALEPVGRGAYTGAVGRLGLDGQMTFNVAIRTMQIRPPTAVLHVGGGIVADSDAAAEYDETLAKARGILRGMGLDVPGNAPVPTTPTIQHNCTR